MKSESSGFICSAVLWIVLFAAIAIVAKNFGSMNGVDDLFSYNSDTGRLCILGETFDAPKHTIDKTLDTITDLGEFYLEFTPYALFSNK